MEGKALTGGKSERQVCIWLKRIRSTKKVNSLFQTFSQEDEK
jgi:hypothetical protein